MLGLRRLLRQVRWTFMPADEIAEFCSGPFLGIEAQDPAIKFTFSDLGHEAERAVASVRDVAEQLEHTVVSGGQTHERSYGPIRPGYATCHCVHSLKRTAKRWASSHPAEAVNRTSCAPEYDSVLDSAWPRWSTWRPRTDHIMPANSRGS